MESLLILYIVPDAYVRIFSCDEKYAHRNDYLMVGCFAGIDTSDFNIYNLEGSNAFEV